MAKSTKSYEARMLEMEKKEQESLEKAKRYAAQKKELLKRPGTLRQWSAGQIHRRPWCILLPAPYEEAAWAVFYRDITAPSAAPEENF